MLVRVNLKKELFSLITKEDLSWEKQQLLQEDHVVSGAVWL